MNRRYLLLFLLGVATLVILAFLFRTKEDSNVIDWKEHYKEDKSAPYGTYLIQELLKSQVDEADFHVVKDSLVEQLQGNETASSYVFIGEAMYIDSTDINALLNFVSRGNIAFISSKTIPYNLMFHLYYYECDEYYWNDYYAIYDTLVHFNFYHPNRKREQAFDFQYFFKNEVKSYPWYYIDNLYFCDEEEGLTPLGTLQDTLINFARVSYGAGFVYLHTNPIAFSNIQLLDQEGLAYADRVFSHFPEESAIYWDSYSRAAEWMGRRMNDRYNYDYERQFATESPLQYILEKRSLSWAWYLLILLGVLYLLFRAKRRQKAIPILDPNKNTSLAFLSSISRLYFLQNNHKQLALQQMKLFQSYVRDKYGLHIRDLDENATQRLSLKSEIAPTHIQKITRLHENISTSSYVSDNTLMDFHQLLDYFYKNCK
ncbi:MAG TPA: hypothetical protein PKA00_21150 [Saprospiraceae bacterium]|nr:hypothetical protein [Saprospiraceae bacterium]HMQ85431.1 hypothetical protein [Saprospiraceae bacterium]